MYLYVSVSIILMLLMFLLYPRFKPALLFLSLAASTVYIVWRFSTIPHTGVPFWGGVVLMAAEIWGLIQFWVFCFLFSQQKKDCPTRGSFETLPSVDIFIPTYGEPVNILRKTIGAAAAIDYPANLKQVCVCDDGKRNEVRQLCKELGVRYIVRETNEHSKSGNINHALAETNGELVVVFDADMIAKSRFLYETVHYFSDQKVGFVQVPQSFYNPDIFQKCFGRKIPGEQDFFMRDVQQRRAAVNAAIHVGTNAVFRRSAIDAIGGYPVFSITEDIALGMLIQAKGYESVYLNEPLVMGLNASNLRDCITQRDRWCRGNLQLLKHSNPLRTAGLNAAQKLAYMDGLLYWYSGILKLIFVLAPILYLLTQVFFINAPMPELLAMFAPYYLSQYLLFSASSPNTRTMFWAHIYETVFAPYIAKSCLAHLLGLGKMQFKVTDKSGGKTHTRFFLKEVSPHIVLICLTVLGWCLGIFRLMHGQMDLNIFIINFVWTVYNIIPMFVALRLAVNRPDNCHSREIDCGSSLSVQLTGSGLECRILRVSGSALSIEQNPRRILLAGEPVSLSFHGSPVHGTVFSSINGVADIAVDTAASDASVGLLSLYADSLRPYYDLDSVMEHREALALAERSMD